MAGSLRPLQRVHKQRKNHGMALHDEHFRPRSGNARAIPPEATGHVYHGLNPALAPNAKGAQHRLFRGPRQAMGYPPPKKIDGQITQTKAWGRSQS